MKTFVTTILIIGAMQLSTSFAGIKRYTSAKQTTIAKEPKLKRIQLPSGVTLEYMEQGNVTGTPVILLHGFTDSWKSFEEVLPHLPSSLHVFSISQRGHGNSSKTATSYKPADFAKDIADFIKQRKLPPAVIVGHSMGSTNAQCFAVHYPELTKALVLMGSFANYNKPFITDFKTAIDGLTEPVDSMFVAEFQKGTITRPISNESLQSFINESRKVPANVWKGVADGWSDADASFVTQLNSFIKPALIVWGDKDVICTKEDQLLLNRTLSKSKLLVYKGTGHALHWEEPVRFANDLITFIKELN
jgi:non-heme chloroperoxidase